MCKRFFLSVQDLNPLDDVARGREEMKKITSKYNEPKRAFEDNKFFSRFQYGGPADCRFCRCEVFRFFGIFEKTKKRQGIYSKLLVQRYKKI